MSSNTFRVRKLASINNENPVKNISKCVYKSVLIIKYEIDILNRLTI